MAKAKATARAHAKAGPDLSKLRDELVKYRDRVSDDGDAAIKSGDSLSAALASAQDKHGVPARAHAQLLVAASRSGDPEKVVGAVEEVINWLDSLEVDTGATVRTEGVTAGVGAKVGR